MSTHRDNLSLEISDCGTPAALVDGERPKAVLSSVGIGLNDDPTGSYGQRSAL
jgi:hypothetical protein